MKISIAAVSFFLALAFALPRAQPQDDVVEKMKDNQIVGAPDKVLTTLPESQARTRANNK
ncbi:MAG: hypothetical protein M1815_004707 [Lichina confinis]|nr:MAG: hypothetical protein M1815_004707 [Lichina confinis]